MTKRNLLFFINFSLICLLFSYHPVLLAGSTGEEQAGNTEKTSHLVNQAVKRWLDVLSKPITDTNDKHDLSFFTKDAQLTLLMSDKHENIKQSLKETIKQRQQAFQGGRYTVSKINVVSNQDGLVKAKVVLDWQRVAYNNKIEKSKIIESIDFVYSKNSSELLIKSITEEFSIPSEGLEVKLKC